jgi:hypothetical protein
MIERRPGERATTAKGEGLESFSCAEYLFLRQNKLGR